MTCEHTEFYAEVQIARISDRDFNYADLVLRCRSCGERVRWLGCPMGLNPGRPMTDVTGTELRMPFRHLREQEREMVALGHEDPSTS